MYRVHYKKRPTDYQWSVTGTMSRKDANKLVVSARYAMSIVVPDQQYMICKNCLSNTGNMCQDHRNRGHKVDPYDTCSVWMDRVNK